MNNFQKIKYILTHLNTRAKLILASGSLVLVGSIVGCNSKAVSDEENVATDTSTTSTEAVTNDTSLSRETEYYSAIDVIENNVVDFNSEALSNGFFGEVNEANKNDAARMFTNAYLAMNISDINGNILNVLDQDLDLNPYEITTDFMNFATYVGRYYQIATPDTTLDFSKYISDQNDVEFITNLSDKIAEMNACTDAESRKAKIAEIVEIKESLLKNQTINTDYSNSTLYLVDKMIIYADAMAKAYGNEIITSEEEKMQLLTSFYNATCEQAVSDGYITEYEPLEYNLAGGYQDAVTSFESIYLSTTDKIIAGKLDRIKSKDIEIYDIDYSYNNLISRVADRIEGLYIAPPVGETNIEKENQIRNESYINNGEALIGTTTTTVVTPTEVPTESIVKPTEVITTPTGEVSTQDYMNGVSAGYSAGGQAAYNKQVSTGKIPSKISSSNVPNVNGSAEYKKGYAEGYVKSWNAYVDSAIKAQQQSTEQFVPVDNNQNTTETTTQKPTETTTETTTQKPTETTTEAPTTIFVPVENGEEFEEEISMLKDIKNMLLFADVYESNWTVTNNANTITKRM